MTARWSIIAFGRTNIGSVFGRRRLGQIHGFGTFLALTAAAYFHSVLLGGISIFVVASPTSSMQAASRTSPRTRRKPMACAWGRAPPASAREPTAPARRPLSLAVIAGTSNVLKPAATEAAVFPAFLFLACCGLAIGLAFTFLGRETQGKTVPQDAEVSAPVAVPVATISGA